MILAWLLPGPLTPSRSPGELLKSISSALTTGKLSEVEAFFRDPRDAESLEQLAQAAPLSKLKAGLLTTPPGWTGYGKYWLELHTFQDPEQNHDPVYQVVGEPGNWQLGREVPEDDLAGIRLKSIRYRAVISPQSGSVDVDVRLVLNRSSSRVDRAPVFRLNDNYLFSPKDALTTDFALQPRPGQIVRVGSLLIPWTLKMAGAKNSAQPVLRFRYSGTMPPDVEDEIRPGVLAITGDWLPSLGRLPCPVEAEIDAPSDWVVRAEGNLVSSVRHGSRTISRFTCPVPISFPKIIGGRYRLAASQSVHGKLFRVYQLPPANLAQAKVDLLNTVASAEFYEKLLGPLPFHGYDVFDSDDYYGVESYSHTLLQKGVTHFISHEMGHTYFGGLAPCPYVHDSWNEGVTQYIDSVVHFGNADESLGKALDGLNLKTPLTKMAAAYGNGGQTYWRGCFVMKMLESEIGLGHVLEALKAIAFGRIGQDTRWDDLRVYFERASKKDLGWFWNQWIDQATFPTLHVSGYRSRQVAGGYLTELMVRQTGTSLPFRLRFSIAGESHGAPFSVPEELREGMGAFSVLTRQPLEGVHVDVVGRCLARVVTTP